MKEKELPNVIKEEDLTQVTGGISKHSDTLTSMPTADQQNDSALKSGYIYPIKPGNCLPTV